MRGSIIGIGSIVMLVSCTGGEMLPPCADNNCTLPGRTTVSWVLNSHPELLFPNDTCLDLGVTTIHAEAVNTADTSIVTVEDAPCSAGQVVFLGLDLGSYKVALTPLDAAGNALVKAPVVVDALAGSPGADTQVTANIPHSSWTGTYTGTFLFRLAWAGMSCEVASPMIATQTLRLVAGGSVATALTDGGQKLDGTDAKPCRPLTESFAQFAPEDPQNQPGLPFGPATLHVVGRDTNGVVTFEKVFETFVGAAKNNPTIMFDVPVSVPL